MATGFHTTVDTYLANWDYFCANSCRNYAYEIYIRLYDLMILHAMEADNYLRNRDHAVLNQIADSIRDSGDVSYGEFDKLWQQGSQPVRP